MNINFKKTCVKRIALLILLTSSLYACGGGGGSSSTQELAVSSPTITVSSPTITEGDVGTSNLDFVVSLSSATSADVTLDYATSNGSATTTDNDYIAISNTTLTIPAGETTATISVTVNNDTSVELDETLNLDLSNISSNAILGTTQAVGTILNNDFPQVSISNAEVQEGDSGSVDIVFNISMDVAGIGDITMEYTTSDISAIAGEDYTLGNGNLTIPEGNTTAEIRITVSGDTTPEGDETFSISLTGLSANARFEKDTALGTIRTDELPQVSISPASIDEGNSGQRQLNFGVTLSAPTVATTTVNYQTVDIGSATAGDDFVPVVNGSITIAQGDTQGVIPITINSDTTDEPDETFEVTLTAVSANTELNVSAATALGTILDDDAVTGGGDSQVSVRNVAVREGDDGEQPVLVFDLAVNPVDNLSDITLDYQTADDAATTSNNDYQPIPLSTLTIPAGSSSAQIAVSINGDTDIENDETLKLELGNISSNASLTTPVAYGLIIDDDDPGQSLPRVSITHSSVLETDQDTIDMLFTVTIVEPVNSIVTVDYTTADIAPTPSAIGGTDYTITSGTLTFQPNETTATITVPIVGETTIENDETFHVILSSPSTNVALGNSIAIGTIISDEPFTYVSINNASILEGDATQQATLRFTVSLSAPSPQLIELDYQALDGTALLADSDYVGVATTRLQIPAGDTSAFIDITINGDDTAETDEQFSVQLSNITANAEISDAIGVGTITNDDNTGGWSLPQPLDPLAVFSNGSFPAVAMSPVTGEAMVTWFVNGSGKSNLTARYSPANGWGTAERAAPNISGNIYSSLNHDISMDDSGNSHLIRNYASRVLTEINTPSTGWGQTTNLTDGFGSFSSMYDVVLASNGSGEVLARFILLNDSVHEANYDPVTGWGPTRTSTFAFSDQMEMDAAGNVITVYREGSSISVRHFDAQNQTWSAAILLSQGISSGSFGSPHLNVNANGTAIAVWDHLGSGKHIYANLYDGANWSAPIMLDSATSYEPVAPKATLDANGNAIVIWLNNETFPQTEYSIRSRRYDFSSDSWSPALGMASDTLVNPRLRIRQLGPANGPVGLQNEPDVPDLTGNDSGDAIVVWSEDVDDDGTHTVSAMQYTIADGWSVPEPLSNDVNGDTSVPRVIMDNNGNGIAVWQHQLPSDASMDFHVWGARYTAP